MNRSSYYAMLLRQQESSALRANGIPHIVSLVLCCVCGVLGINHALLQMRVASARGQVAVFAAMEGSAQHTTDTRKLAECLDYVVNYYPSGSKQKVGSSLDYIVETARSNATIKILDRLRSTAAVDLGPDVNKWLQKYAEH